MKQPKLESKIPPLRDIHFESRPLVKRALAWSCDGELAVAADDSVHILVPEFPDPRAAEEEGDAARSGREDDDDETESEDPDHRDLRPAYLRHRHHTRQRPQFSGGGLQIPVSYPRLDPRVNRDLFEAAGVPFPLDATNDARGGEGGGDDDDQDDENDGDDDDDDDDFANDGESGSESDSDTSELSLIDESDALGAGVVSGTGSTLNHLVCISWSPTGLGPSCRPILAVLTSAGVIAMYGDSPTSAPNSGFSGLRGEKGLLKRRSLASWGVLWGVGGRLAVPGQQQSETSDFVRAFAWSRQMGPGQVLLAYITDVRDVVIISVQAASVPGEPGGKSKGTTAGDARGEMATWRVQEVARFRAEGPHPKISVWDPDYVPQGTSFGLRWSPWLLSGGSRTCVLSYIDTNYVGFRRVVVNGHVDTGESTNLNVGQTDVYGKCVALSSDSFVEFEEAIWTRGVSKVVRGILATGFHVQPFDVALTGSSSEFEARPHPPEECGTTYSYLQLHHSSTNPIQDLIIHPPNLVKSTETPIYTLIRLSTTSSNHDWYQTNASPPGDSSTGTGARPRWASDITQKLEISVPIDLHKHGSFAGANDADSDDADSDDGGDGDNLASVGDAAAYSDDSDSDGAIPQGPEFHPHRFRLHGLAASPGGGASAVLVSGFGTRKLAHGRWSDLTSTLMFDSQPRPPHGEEAGHKGVLRPLTTEGRLWEWMYGAGADVPGITTYGSECDYDDQDEEDDAGGNMGGKRKRMGELFREAIARQRCAFCLEPLQTKGPGERLSSCWNGHFFTTCGTSGLAIQAPGISRTCGACGARTLKVEALVSSAPELEDGIREVFTGDACGNCGGKFVD